MQIDSNGELDRVVLILQNDATGELSGQIQFGEGTPPTDPGDAPYGHGLSGADLYGCSIMLPTKGFQYGLLNPELSSDRLMFQIIPNDVWTPWCITQDSQCPQSVCTVAGPTCTCTGGKCSPADHLRISIDLARTSEQLEGEMPFGGNTPGELRLTRVQ